MNSQTLIKQSLDETFDPNNKKLFKKRTSIESKLSNFDNLVKKPKLFSIKSSISFNVQSSTDSNKNYTVTIESNSDDIIFQCNCGDQWNIKPRRNNCKHIGAVISNLLKKFVQNHQQNDVIGDNDMENILDKLNKILLL